MNSNFLRRISKNRISKVIIFATPTITISAFIFASTVDQTYAAKYPRTAPLNGQNEIPSVELDATGTADFKLAENEAIGYRVNVTVICNASAAHIHQGKAGENSDVVADLLHTPILNQFFIW